MMNVMMKAKKAAPQVYYGVWDRFKNSIPTECKYEFKDLGAIVPDKCCTGAPTVQPPLDFEGNTRKSFKALPGANPYIRDYLACSNGKPTFAEVCVPAGASF